jgi:hypothetical protein
MQWIDFQNFIQAQSKKSTKEKWVGSIFHTAANFML